MFRWRLQESAKRNGGCSRLCLCHETTSDRFTAPISRTSRKWILLWLCPGLESTLISIKTKAVVAYIRSSVLTLELLYGFLLNSNTEWLLRVVQNLTKDSNLHTCICMVRIGTTYGWWLCRCGRCKLLADHFKMPSVSWHEPRLW